MFAVMMVALLGSVGLGSNLDHRQEKKIVRADISLGADDKRANKKSRSRQ